MASFSSLPWELVLHISRLLDLPDLKSMGSLNSRFRESLAAVIFRTLRFTNLDEDEDVISRIVSKYGAHVNKLCFDFHLRQDPDQTSESAPPEGRRDSADDKADGEGKVDGTKLSDVAERLLDGEKLAHVAALRVNFSPEDDFYGEAWGDSEGLGGIYIYQDVTEDPDMLEQEEQEWPSWRRAMSHMWSVLCCNRRITSLEIRDLPALPVSSWLQPPWPAFLGRLEVLVLGLGGGGDDWYANTAEGYGPFLEALGSYLFDHAKGLRKLHLIADRENYYGYNNLFPSTMALRPGQMTELEELHIENCFIDEQCCGFLHAASRSPSPLTKLHLVDCMANDDTPSWAELFTRLSAAGEGLSLTEFVVANETIELPYEQEANIHHLPVTNRLPGFSVAFRSSPAEDAAGKDRPFAYGYISGKYGSISSHEERNIDELRAGTDAEAYRRLMALVAANAEAAAGSSCHELRGKKPEFV